MKDAELIFNSADVLRKFGDNPSCYLTGRAINWEESDTYNFDHFVPASKGGDNSLENLRLSCPSANRAKYDLSFEEFIILCRDVLIKNGYTVSKKDELEL
jgi:5-methylcytosine-specific restriction endonuclease McrA